MSLNNESAFPMLDANRDHQPGRVVLDDLGLIEPYVDETDYWCSMPLRVSHSPTTHVAIEIGPYTIDSRDIERLREALRVYDITTKGQTIRRVK
ncbi:hypothetical protein [Mycolicibacterium sp. CR10]|uniref:hypothetical protein n=1 Tax=Mycolicibacterium sp. CR10 TaxID=2562314 RepID=UPI0010C0973D|nr:hypothetical protein [Mycolicibacterium sp. CR10]